MYPKISIVTVTRNSSSSVVKCLDSINGQTWLNREHIVIDGASSDNTLSLLQDHSANIDVLVSEPDRGIYDALNKGFACASGDIIGILHSDDQYFDNFVLERIALCFQKFSVDYVYGDIVFVDSCGERVRYWRPGELPEGRITSAQIPHTSLFISSGLLESMCPPFDSSYSISGDVKHQLIIANVLNARGYYLPACLVEMRLGGASTANLGSYLLGWSESIRAWNEVHGHGGFVYLIKKLAFKCLMVVYKFFFRGV